MRDLLVAVAERVTGDNMHGTGDNAYDGLSFYVRGKRFDVWMFDDCDVGVFVDEKSFKFDVRDPGFLDRVDEMKELLWPANC